MKKTTFAVGSAALIAEFVLFISFCKLTESSNYYWIGAGVAGLLAMITVFFICAKFTELLVDIYSEHLKKMFDNNIKFHINDDWIINIGVELFF